MTLEEAKKILEEEGFYVEKATRPCVLNEWFTKYESPEICEAVQVVCSAGYKALMFETAFQARKERLKKEYEKYTKAPGPGEEQPKEGNPALAESASQFNDALLDEQAKKIKSLVKDITHMDNVIYKKNLEIDKQNQEITRLLSLVEKKENSISRLHYEKSVLEKENEELKKGEIPARYFDKALVDEQSEKIKKLEHEKLNILEMASSCKQTIAELTKEKSNLEDQITVLNACKKHNDRIDRKQIKGLGKEIAKLNGIIHDKNAILSDVAEELRLTKIREKNLVGVSQKYMKENEELKKELADKVVDKIDSQALKSAESALAYKDEVIETLDKELAEAKHELSSLKRPFRPDSTEAVVLFANAYAKAEKKHLRCAEWRNDGKEVSVTYILKNGKKSKITLDFTGDDIIFSRTDPDKKPRIPTPEESRYDSIIERCKRLGIELHYHDGKVPTYTNMFGNEVPVYGLRGIFATCTDEEYKSLFKK